MATRPYQFVAPLLKAQWSIRDIIGTDIMSASKSAYDINLQMLALIAMTLKIIQDLHPTVVTDAVLLQRLSEAIETGPGGVRSGWPGWAVLQIRPGDLEKYGAEETDTVAQLQAKIEAYNNAGGA